MTHDNPFHAPSPALDPGPPAAEVVSASLRAMRWPHLVLGGLGVMGALVMLGFGLLAMVGSVAATGPERFMVLGLGVVYVLFGLLYGVPAGLLVRSGIALALSSADDAQLAVSARMQLWFWRVLLLQVLGLVGVYLVLIAVVVVASIGRA